MKSIESLKSFQFVDNQNMFETLSLTPISGNNYQYSFEKVDEQTMSFIEVDCEDGDVMKSRGVDMNLVNSMFYAVMSDSGRDENYESLRNNMDEVLQESLDGLIATGNAVVEESLERNENEIEIGLYNDLIKRMNDSQKLREIFSNGYMKKVNIGNYVTFLAFKNGENSREGVIRFNYQLKKENNKILLKRIGSSIPKGSKIIVIQADLKANIFCVKAKEGSETDRNNFRKFTLYNPVMINAFLNPINIQCSVLLLIRDDGKIFKCSYIGNQMDILINE